MTLGSQTRHIVLYVEAEAKYVDSQRQAQLLQAAVNVSLVHHTTGKETGAEIT